MGKARTAPETVDNETRITLELLNAVHESSSLTQRGLAGRLEIALGLANAYLKRCMKKGLIKVKTVPANRYGYYLTPKGFAEKSRLTARYLSMSFDFFRHARSQCRDVFETCAEQGWNRVALVGASDLAEIAMICAADLSIELVGVLDEDDTAAGEALLGRPVVSRFDALAPLDALVITDLAAPQETFERTLAATAGRLDPARVLSPSLLNITRPATGPASPKASS